MQFKQITVFFFLSWNLLFFPSLIQAQELNDDLGCLSANAAIEDINFIQQHLEQHHYNPYLYITKETFNEKKEQLFSYFLTKDSLPKTDFIIKTMQLIATIDDGHTNVRWFSEEILKDRNNMHFFPAVLKFNVNQQLMYTTKDTPTPTPFPVKSINQINATYLYQDALNCLAGNDYYTNDINSAFFFPIYLYLKGFEPPYHLTLENGQTITFEKEDEVSFIDLYYRLKPAGVNYELKILDEQTAYIAYNSCTDYDKFKSFLEDSFQRIHEKNIQSLVIDIRNNSGGDSSLNDLLLAYLTTKEYRQMSRRYWKKSDVAIQDLLERGAKEHYGEDFTTKYQLKDREDILDFGGGDELTKAERSLHFFEGKTCFLIGPRTFSSANMLADAVATYQLSTLIGQATGEKTNDFGEQKEDILPHSKVPFTYTIAFDIGANGDADDTSTVQPDIKVEQDALEFALEWLKK